MEKFAIIIIYFIVAKVVVLVDRGVLKIQKRNKMYFMV